MLKTQVDRHDTKALMLLAVQFPGLLSTSHDKLDQPNLSVTSGFLEDADIPAADVSNIEKPRL